MVVDRKRWCGIVYLAATSGSLLLLLVFLFLFPGKLSLAFFKRIVGSGHIKPHILNLCLMGQSTVFSDRNMYKCLVAIAMAFNRLGWIT